MNILLVLPSLLIGGAEVFVVRLANRLAQRNHQVFLLHFDPARRSPLLEERISQQVKVVTFDYKLTGAQKIGWKLLYTLTNWNENLRKTMIFKRKKLDAIQLAEFLDAFCDREKIQVINSHLLMADWMVAHYFWQKKRPQRFVISMHGCYNRVEYRPNSIFHNLKQDNRHLLEVADRIVLLTAKNAIPLEGFSLNHEPDYIPLGIEKIWNRDLSTHHFSNKPLTFGLVSRAIARKGWEEAIQATQQLNKEGISCRLVLVGDGEYRHKLQQEFSNLPYVHFVGATAQVLDWVKQFDVGLFPSYIESESYPNTVMEYLSCGKPVIGTDIGEVKNMMSIKEGDQTAGQLLRYDPAGISVVELTDCLRRYLTDPILLHSHRKLARVVSEKFDLDRCVSAYEHVYK